MYCSKCGKLIKANSKFCSFCGQKIEHFNDCEEMQGRIHIIRESCLEAKAVKFKVILDGEIIDLIENGEEKTYNVSYGKHSIQFQLMYKAEMLKRYEFTSEKVFFEISEQNNIIRLKCYPRKTRISSYAMAGAMGGIIGISRGVRETKKILDNRNNYIVIEHI